MTIDQYNLRVGEYLPDWKTREFPKQKTMSGHFCSVVPLDIALHAKDLYEAYALDQTGRSWTYLPYGPFETLDHFIQWISTTSAEKETLLYSIVDARAQKPIGIAGYLRINCEHGVAEIGHVHFSKLLQKKPAATEAMYLMMFHIFEELQYRRYEWKCHSFNEASRRAATRLGFQFEGIFRQCNVVKNHNRDTAWFSVIDKEWPLLRKRFESWLNQNNFDEKDEQIIRLEDCSDG